LADCFIAATADLHGLTLVTLNAKHFPMSETMGTLYQPRIRSWAADGVSRKVRRGHWQRRFGAMIRNLFHVRLFDNQSTRGDRGGALASS